MKTFILNIIYRIRWWFINETTAEEKYYEGMHKTMYYNFKKETIWNHFNKYYSNNSEIGKTLGHSEDCIENTPEGIRLVCKRNEDDHTYQETPVYIGMLNTKRKFSQKFGIFELICKVPEGEGKFWPAFWGYGDGKPIDEKPPEIDWFEMMSPEGKDSSETHRLSTTIHWCNSEGKHQQKGRMLKINEDLSKDYHKYGIKWTEKRLTWYLDDIPLYTRKNIYDMPMYVLANISSKWPYEVSINNPGYFYLKRLIIHQFI